MEFVWDDIGYYCEMLPADASPGDKPHYVDITVWKIDGMNGDRPEFERSHLTIQKEQLHNRKLKATWSIDKTQDLETVAREWDMTSNPLEATPCLDGSIKWDGCSNFNFGPQGEQPTTHFFHFCGSGQVANFGTMLLRLYKEAAVLMGRADSDLT